jgi:outer membrane autotransporter protein
VVNNSNFAQTIALDINLGANQPFASNTANLLVSGAINGTAALTKMGNKTLTLTGNNTNSGGTTVTEGTLAGTTQGLKGSIVNNAVVNFDQSFNGTYTGVLSGTGSLTKTGSGVVLLSGNNTYSGGATINSGVLAASVVSGNLVTLNPNAFGTGGVNINAGGAMLVPSTTPGGAHLSIRGDLTLNNGTIAFYDIGESPRDQDLRVDVTENFTNAGSGVVFDFSQVQALDSGNYTLVSYNGTNFATTAISSRAGVGTTLQGSFSFVGSSLVFNVLGAQSSGTDIQNKGGPNTPIVANYNVSGPTITIGDNNIVSALTFNSGGSLNIQSNGVLNVTSGALNVQNGSSVVGGGNLVAPAGLNKDGTGELDFTNNVVVTGTAAVNEGLLSVNGNFVADNVVVNPSGTLGGSGTIFSNVNVQGNLAPGNSPGTLTVAGNLILTGANSTIIEIASATNYDRIIVSGQATLGGTLNAVAYGGGTITPGARYDFLQAGSIVGEFDSLIAPDGLRVRFLSSGTTGTLLFGPGSYVPMALNPNQQSVAKALDTFIEAKDGDRLAVSIALDSLTTEQFPAAFDQIMPGFYESLANISIEQAFNQTQMLNQRISSVRLGAAGFQAMGGISQPLLYDKDGKSSAEAKDASPIVESAMATNWNTWALGNGQFSRTTNLSNLLNSNTDAGGFLVGADYRWSENFVSGLYAGYEYTYSKYGSDSNMRGNGVNFGGYASYATEEGYYADAVVGGGYTGYQTRRSIQFSTIDRTAQADPNATQFSAALNLGKDFEIGKFTLGPIVGAQYTYAGIGSFTETGAESLDLSLAQQNANSLRSTLGGRIAYTWNLNQTIAFIPEVRMFWQHEFLNNARNIGASLDGGNGAGFDFETTDPYRDSVFAGAGVTAQFGKNLSGSVFYNVNFGSQTYQSNMVSVGLNVSF